MDDAARVSRLECVGERDGVIDERPDRERTSGEHLVQACAGEQLHHQIGLPLIGADVEERADVRVIERRDRTPLALESRQGVRRPSRRDREDLDRHLAAEPRIGAAIDLTHPAFAKLRDDGVRAEPPARSEVHRAGILRHLARATSAPAATPAPAFRVAPM